ncbi:Gfo/Idh/MocA family oxidoreductase [Treponema sp. OttesenSCG-928-L16]|nr:Gfo/Idh/MocA family oxidoreductase [Treponema sp. OttesenSCG-928-L16]
MKKDRYGFGIIGLGAIASIHADALKQIPAAELTALYDTVPGRARDFAEKYGGSAYDDLEAFLDHPGLDIVTVTTPSGLHRDVSIAAAQKGKHLIVEKPLEISPERCDDVIKAASSAGVLLGGIFQSRFFDSARLIKKAIDQGRFGKIVLCDAYVKWFRSQEYYDSGAWRGTKEIDGGGALMNQSIHAADLLLWFGGAVKEVYSFSETLTHERIEVEDTLVASIRFKSGALGSLEASTSVWPGSPKRIEVRGSSGSAVMEEEKIIVWDFEKELPEDAQIRERYSGNTNGSGAADPMAISFYGHQMQFEDFLDALRDKRPPLVDGREARKAVELIRSIYTSAETGKAVSLS